MVPVFSDKGEVLFPCKERRARCLMNKGEAKPYYQKGIFCIKLTRKETEQREVYPEIALGIDPGSKREGYTVLTPKRVVMNITSDTPGWVKKKVELRRILRRSRRQRKTPYRKCRWNRGTLKNETRVPPSTKARWDAKLRIINILITILPITIINVEDIAAISLKGKKKWNQSFSPLEVGKTYFYNKISELYPNIKLVKTKGYDTYKYRNERGFDRKKSSKKLDDKWEAHNIDSHSLAEMSLSSKVKPFYGLNKLSFLNFYRRQIHVTVPAKKGIRKSYGRSVTQGISRGSVMRYSKDNKLYYLGGESKGRVTIHNMITKERVSQSRKMIDMYKMYTCSWIVNYIYVN